MTLTLQFVKNRILDYEIKLRNEKTDTSTKVLAAQTLEQHKVKLRGPMKNGKPFKTKHDSNHPPYNNFKWNKNQKHRKPENTKCVFCGRKNHEKKNCFFYIWPKLPCSKQTKASVLCVPQMIKAVIISGT